MKKLIARLMTIGLLTVSLAAFAQTGTDANKDTMKPGTAQAPSTPRSAKSATTHNTGMKKHSTTKDNMKPDSSKKSAAKKDSAKKDDSAPKQ